MKTILDAAKNDYDSGYLTSIRSLIHAEVFENELEQAEELLRARYAAPAVVVAGVVLETHLREMAKNRGVATANLDKMNADLARVGAYNSMVQKRITACAGLRNSAAHGAGGFSPQDAAAMIDDVRRFLTDYPS